MKYDSRSCLSASPLLDESSSVFKEEEVVIVLSVELEKSITYEVVFVTTRNGIDNSYTRMLINTHFSSYVTIFNRIIITRHVNMSWYNWMIFSSPNVGVFAQVYPPV